MDTAPTPMRRYPHPQAEQSARADAAERGLAYGWSVLSPGWYVGTPEQLRAIGVQAPVSTTSPNREGAV